jgi:hypothetical protein
MQNESCILQRKRVQERVNLQTISADAEALGLKAKYICLWVADGLSLLRAGVQNGAESRNPEQGGCKNGHLSVSYRNVFELFFMLMFLFFRSLPAYPRKVKWHVFIATSRKRTQRHSAHVKFSLPFHQILGSWMLLSWR